MADPVVADEPRTARQRLENALRDRATTDGEVFSLMHLLDDALAEARSLSDSEPPPDLLREAVEVRRYGRHWPKDWLSRADAVIANSERSLLPSDSIDREALRIAKAAGVQIEHAMAQPQPALPSEPNDD